MSIFIGIVIFILGLIFGSFFNVCIYRIPREKSIILPRSFCPYCGKTISALDNVPILSFIFLKGKCRYCSNKISIRYLIVEIVTSLLFILLYLKFSLSFEFFKYLIIVSLSIIIFFIDLEFMIIPDEISIPFIIVGLVINFFYFLINKLNLINFLKDYGLGMIIGGVIFFVIYILGYIIFKREAFGVGDIKLGILIGGFMGLEKTLAIIYVAIILGGIVGIIFYILGYRRKEIPFAPFLNISTILIIFFYNCQISEMYQLYKSMHQ